MLGAAVGGAWAPDHAWARQHMWYALRSVLQVHVQKADQFVEHALQDCWLPSPHTFRMSS